MKKFISKVLICAMLISVLPKTSFAHEEKINTTTVSEEQKAKTEKVEKKEEVKAEEKVEKKEEAKAEEKVEKKEEVKAEEKVEKKEETKAEEKAERKEEVKTETKLEQSVIASPIKARATEPRYSVEFHFDPIPDSKPLPQAIIDKLPEDKTNVEDGTVINLPSFADEVVEDKGGFWKFIGWEMFPVIRSTRNLIDGNTVTVNGSDLVIIGKWGFEASYFVEYAFKSITAGKELPEDVLVKLPEKQTGIPAETEITLPEMTDIKVDGGTWKFVRWSWGAYYRGTRDDGQNQSVFVNQDLLVTGEWEYVEDPEPEKYDVTFTFKSETPGKELADEVKAKTPANKLGVENETVIFLEKYADVKVEGGTWKFVKWQLATADGIVDVEDEVEVNGSDLNFTGLWKFEPDTEKYNVTFHFVTLTLGKELPQEVLDKKPANQSDVPSGTVIPLPKFEDVKVEGGTWKFRYWYLSLGDHGNEVENEITVENADLFLIGGWEFEKDPEPKKYDVTFSFESETPGKELPDEIKAKIPADQLGVPDGTLIHLPKYDSVKVEGGKWEFVHWRIEVEGKDDDFSLGIDKFVNGADMKMVGIWKFEEDPKPEKYNIEFQFYSVTKGKELPDEIKAKLPANKTDVLNGTVITLPTYEDVKVEGGKWVFEGWLLETEFGYIDVKNEVVVNNGNLFLAGPWRFEADKKPAPPKPLKPQKPKVKVQKGRMLPKTNVESAFSYVLLALAGIGGAYIAKKKDNE
ncbi:SHIRT domain-containing protein [Parvimonas micra]|uniref:SHIRT domain-containing protein n=1 Tax=Parvimonas micra TaxID=33033 RepID=UPI00248F3E66|nr:SHIRT domain-containing protein [Parvimonas micra]